MVTYFVLRERATKRLMPAAKVQTRAEFGDNGPPRLFISRAAAASALTCWRMGLWRLTGEEDGYCPEPSMWSGNEAISERRRATEVEVVPVRLIEMEKSDA